MNARAHCAPDARNANNTHTEPDSKTTTCVRKILATRKMNISCDEFVIGKCACVELIPTLRHTL